MMFFFFSDRLYLPENQVDPQTFLNLSIPTDPIIKEVLNTNKIPVSHSPCPCLLNPTQHSSVLPLSPIHCVPTPSSGRYPCSTSDYICQKTRHFVHGHLQLFLFPNTKSSWQSPELQQNKVASSFSAPSPTHSCCGSPQTLSAWPSLLPDSNNSKYSPLSYQLSKQVKQAKHSQQSLKIYRENINKGTKHIPNKCKPRNENLVLF